MKVIKPQKLALLHRTFEHDGACYFVVSVVAFCTLDASPQLLPEVALWEHVAKALGAGAPLDEGMSKQRGELLVTGSAFTAGAVPRVAARVRVEIGSIDKTLYVVGDRTWKHGIASEPEPFTRMPVTYPHAFGGPGHAPNPTGKGFAPVQNGNGTSTHPLPNVEDPKRLVRSPSDRPPPAGFGAYDFTWPQRFSKLGTYDATWLRELAPGLARDLDWGAFSTAPDDQQIEGYFRGDEAVRIENMHPERPAIEARLPAVAARAFITQRTPTGETFREIATRLDTVHLFPHAERAVLIFRGMVRIAEDDAADVVHVLAGLESLTAPKPADHYRTVLDQRLDKDKGYLLALRDADLLPEDAAAPEPTAMEGLVRTKGLARKRARRRAERQHEKGLQRVRDMGLDPIELGFAPTLPAEEPEPSLEEIPAFMERARATAEQARADAEQRNAETEAKNRKLFESQGLDYDATMTPEEGAAGGPPKFSAKAELEKFEQLRQMARAHDVDVPELDAMLDDEELPKRLAAMEEQVQGAYRKFAHLFPPARIPGAAEGAELRARVIAAHAAGESLAGKDLTGVDLSDLSLAGLDLRGASLEGANLARASLDGACLADAVLARADVGNASLREADLAGANLGEARLVDAVLDGADLRKAVLAKADLARASFVGAKLEAADLLETRFDATVWTGVSAPGGLFMKTDLTGLQAAGADLAGCTFLECSLERADLTGANLTGANLVTTRADGAILREATLENLRVVHGSSLVGADFRRANLDRANLRSTPLAGADFTESSLTGANLSECGLAGSSFVRVRARQARFDRADLTGARMAGADLLGASLQKVKAQSADLDGANLFGADLAKMRGDSATQFKNANLGRVRVVPVRNHG